MTLEELWKRKIESKWMPIHFQGPRIKDWLLRKELVARLDSILSGYLASYEPFAEEISKATGIPYYYSCRQYKDIVTKSEDFYKKHSDLVEEWIKHWGANPYSGCDSTVFSMNTFSDSCNSCFFNPKTGKVGSIHSVGKWVGNMSELKPEIEWFAKEFPEVELYLTFEDYVENDKDPFYTEPFATIHLKDGNIELVKTKKLKKRKCVGVRSAIDHSRLYYNLRNFFTRIYINLLKVFDYDKYMYNHNYVRFANCANNRFFNVYEFLSICEYWNDVLRVKEKYD